MLKKILLAIVTMMLTMSFAFAQVDVNKADQAALDGVKGIGPAKSKMIIDERTKGGEFKDWADFEKRVKGIGAKNSVKLSQAGLQVNGQSKTGGEMKPAAAVTAKPMASTKKDAMAGDTKAMPADMPKAK